MTRIADAARAGRADEVRALLSQGEDPNQTSGLLLEPLVLLAAASGSAATLEALLAAGADPNARDFGGGTALHEAAREGNAAMIRALVARGAELETFAKDTGYTALGWAIWYARDPGDLRRIESVKALLEGGARIAHDVEPDCAPLTVAVRTRNLPILECLLEARPPGNAASAALASAVLSGFSEGVAALAGSDAVVSATPSILLAVARNDENGFGAALEAATEGERTSALLWAACLGRPRFVSALLEPGLPSGRSPAESPLAAAARLGHWAVVRRLLEAGANPAVRDAEGDTPLHRAARVTAPEGADLVDALLAAGAQPRAKNSHDHTPLAEAIGAGSVGAARALLAAGARAGSEGPSLFETAAAGHHTELLAALADAGVSVAKAGASALHAAARSGSVAAIEWLVAHGAPVEARREGETPLYAAASAGEAAAVLALVAAGANLNAVSQGQTPLLAAASGGHVEAANTLLERGAKIPGKGSLPMAAARGDAGEVKRALASKERGDTRDPKTSLTPLDWAVRLDRREALAALLEAKPSREALDGALLAAASLSRDAALAALLASSTFPADALGRALAEAARKGSAVVATRLLDAGADPNFRDSSGQTPLLIAAEEENAGLVALLRARGGDPDLEDRWGISTRERLDEDPDDEEDEDDPQPAPAPARPTATSHRPYRRAGKLTTAERGLLSAAQQGDLEGVSSALARGTDPNAVDERGSYPLGVALRYPPIVDALLAAGANPNGTEASPALLAAAWQPQIPSGLALLGAGAAPEPLDDGGRSALMIAAAREGGEALVAALLARGASVSRTDRDGWTPVTFAATNGHLETLRTLLAAGGAPEGSGRDKGFTEALAHAAEAGHAAIARALLLAPAGREPRLAIPRALAEGNLEALSRLSKGAVDSVDSAVKWPPILWAALLGPSEAIARLLAAGADARAKKGRVTVIGLAALGDREGVLALLEAGAPPDAVLVGDTPRSLLSKAAHDGDADLVDALLARGAKKDPEAVLAAVHAGHDGVVERLARARVPLNETNPFGISSLEMALVSGRYALARTLLAAGASASPKGAAPALATAIARGDDAAVALLLEARADVNAKDEDGETALFAAVRTGRSELVARLLAAGARAAVSARGRTPLELAATLGLADVCAALTAAGGGKAASREALPAAVAAELEKAFRVSGKAAPLSDAFRIGVARTPTERVVFQGAAGRIFEASPSALDERLRSLSQRSPCVPLASAISGAVTDLGYTPLGDVFVEAGSDVLVRLWGTPKATAWFVWNLPLFGLPALDAVTEMEDGSFLTTTTLEGASTPERGFFVRSFPGAWPAVLERKHAQALAVRAAVTPPRPAEPDLQAVLAALDRFLVRRLTV